MKKTINTRMSFIWIGIIAISIIVGCSLPGGGGGGGGDADTIAPTVASTSPADAATSVPVNGLIIATFSEDMDSATIVDSNFTVAAGAIPVTGTVSYDQPSKTATFAPAGNLARNTVYTATITTGAKDLAGNALAADTVWTFTSPLGPEPVLLGTSGNFAILSQAGISTVPSSAITGDIGVSPIATTAITGFNLDPAVVTAGVTVFATSAQVTGFVYGADMAASTAASLAAAVLDKGTAYTDAAGRLLPDHLNLLSGNIAGQTLAPGLYKWGSSVSIASDITISGGANDVWIFQIEGGLALADAAHVVLSGGAQAKNIFWQLTGVAALGTAAHLEGIILCQTAITLGTGATMNGIALAGTNVTLDQSTVTKPTL